MLTQITTQDDADRWECQHALSAVTNVIVEAWAYSYGAGDEAATKSRRRWSRTPSPDRWLPPNVGYPSTFGGQIHTVGATSMNLKLPCRVGIRIRDRRGANCLIESVWVCP